MNNIESIVSDWYNNYIPKDAEIVIDRQDATIKVATAFYAGPDIGWRDDMHHKIKTLRFVQYKMDNLTISEWIWKEGEKICQGYYNPNKRVIFVGRHTRSIEIL